MKSQNTGMLLVPLSNSFGGTEVVTKSIAEWLHDKGENFGLILPNNSSLNKMAEVIQGKTNIIERINPVVGRSAFGMNLKIAYKIIKETNPNCIHFHCPNVRWGLDVLMAASIANVPHIIRTEHNPLMSSPTVLVKLILWLVSRKVNIFTYVSEGNKNRYEYFLPYRIGRGLVVHNGVDTNCFYPDYNNENRQALRNNFGFPENCHVAVFVGTYQSRRPITPILEAFHKLISDENSNEIAKRWRLLIVGSGPNDQTSLAKKLGIEDFVEFAGPRNDVPALIRHCDLFVSASQFEGMSLAILEAWASGIPVLATQVDGLSDIIGEKNVKRFMVPIGDVGSFASIWFKFMTFDSKMLSMHEAATREVRTNYTTKKMVCNYQSLYDELI
jgi:glycosyltransferase involved in cell wall biosynthesis